MVSAYNNNYKFRWLYHKQPKSNSSNHSLIKRPCGSNNKCAAEEYIFPDLVIMEAEITQLCNTASKVLLSLTMLRMHI